MSISLAKSEFTYDFAIHVIDIEAILYHPDAVVGYEFFRLIDRSPISFGRDTGFDLKSGATIKASVTDAYSPTDGRL
jgi:hypothetical protein